MNPYKILGLNDGSSQMEIKSAFRTLAKIYHPDLNNQDTTDKFREILVAYELLKQMNWKWNENDSKKIDFQDVYEHFTRNNPGYARFFGERVTKGQARWESLRKRP